MKYIKISDKTLSEILSLIFLLCIISPTLNRYLDKILNLPKKGEKSVILKQDIKFLGEPLVSGNKIRGYVISKRNFAPLGVMHPITKEIKPHYGTDLLTPNNTPLYPPLFNNNEKFLRIYCGKDRDAGILAVVEDIKNRIVIRLFHLSSCNYNKADQYPVDKPFAFTGNSGLSTGPHLHIELGVDVDYYDTKGIVSKKINFRDKKYKLIHPTDRITEALLK